MPAFALNSPAFARNKLYWAIYQQNKKRATNRKYLISNNFWFILIIFWFIFDFLSVKNTKTFDNQMSENAENACIYRCLSECRLYCETIFLISRNLARLPAPAHKDESARNLDPPSSEVSSLITSIIAFSNTLPGLSFKIFGALTDNIIKLSDIEITSEFFKHISKATSLIKGFSFCFNFKRKSNLSKSFTRAFLDNILILFL